MEYNLMTAEELLEKYKFEAGEHIGNRDYDKMCEFAKEFATMHVEAALMAALEEVPYGGSDAINYEDVVGILTCYPLTNIK
jgi:hypothetical protein